MSLARVSDLDKLKRQIKELQDSQAGEEKKWVIGVVSVSCRRSGYFIALGEICNSFDKKS